MSRRKTQLFNLSFLDLLTSALGAIIFLFVITPKGGESAALQQQAAVYFDTSQMKLYGDLHDSLLQKGAGDTLFAVVIGHKSLPKPAAQKVEKPIAYQPPVRQEWPKPKASKPTPKPEKKPTPEKKQPVKEEKKPEPRQAQPEKPQSVPTYRGDAPSVPCDLSIEINWRDKANNVDLFVCKDNACVYGGRKRDRLIGQWDSGKSRNRLFGNDLRTNQEAVRQFDGIIPGEYKVYAQFKESDKDHERLYLTGLIYTKNDGGQERGESFSRTLTLGQDRVLIATIIINENGSYQIKKA